MSGLLRFIGSMCIFIFMVSMLMGTEILDDLPEKYASIGRDINHYKWGLLITGIILSVLGTITKVRKRLNDRNKHKDPTSSSASSKTLGSSTNERLSSSYKKKDFIGEQHQYKAEQFANNQQGQLKELAMKIDWSPLAGGGANFKTSTLKMIKSSRLEVVKSTGGYLFALIFAAVGFGVMIGMGYSIYSEDGLTWELLFPLLFGGTFAAIGIGLLYWPRPRIFDRRTGWFWAGNRSLSREQDLMKLKYSARLSEISVIQIVSERVSSDKGGSYTSWEINIVSEDGARLNVMDHGKYESIFADAELLGEFLGVPVWENS